MGRYSHSLSLDATIMVSKNCPIIGGHVVIIFLDTIGYHSKQYDLFKTPLLTALGAYNSKNGTVNFFLYYQRLISMIKHNFWQSVKKILYMGFRATLNFRKFKVALNSMYRIF